MTVVSFLFRPLFYAPPSGRESQLEHVTDSVGVISVDYIGRLAAPSFSYFIILK